MDDQSFKNVMAATPAPVTVVTTAGITGPVGCTVSAFMSLSLSPRMVAVALNSHSSLLADVDSSEVFGVNLLGAAQSGIALQFASSGIDRFSDVAWYADGGIPRLHGTAAWLRCRLVNRVDAGDHVLLMGEVLDAVCSTTPPMVYAERLFGGHSGLQDRPRPVLSRHVAACAH
jgi:flavin reductase (DIM6/NTAB) family NADH-FMN oxidoreductase RutF